jgi:hypothetical protein
MPRKKKLPVTGGPRVDAYAVLVRAVEEGAAYGYRHAHKHTSKPGEEAILGEIESGVVNAICEVFRFEPVVE